MSFFSLFRRQKKQLFDALDSLHKQLEEQRFQIKNLTTALTRLELRQMGIRAPYFSRDWFNLSPEAQEFLIENFQGRPQLRFLEIGTFEGRSALWFLNNVLTESSSHLWCVDHFKGSEEHRGTNALYQADVDHLLEIATFNLKPFADRITLMQGSSHDLMPTLEEKSYDFIFIDGSHFSADVYQDAQDALRLLKPKGVILFDDYEWKYSANQNDNPAVAIDRFLREQAGKFVDRYRGYQLLVQAV